MSLGSSVEDEDSPLIFLEKVHLFRERVEVFTASPLPSATTLSVTPRAVEYLQQHWPTVTIGSLEEAPVPKVCCCTRCGNAGALVETEAGRDRSDTWIQDLWCRLRPTFSVVLLGLGLLLLLLWINPVGGASLGFSLVSRFIQLVHGLSSELIAAVWDAVESASTVMGATVERWSSRLSSVCKRGFQQWLSYLKP